MTSDLHHFDQSPTWYNIANGANGFIGTPNAIAYSGDANHLFVGTLNGRLYRISNLALAYNFERADVSSPSCIVSLQEIELKVPGTNENLTQAITSISVDPTNSNNVIITVGNYGNDNYVFYSKNALSQHPDFMSRQGNLPHMPVYSSLIEMTNSEVALVGTEHGVFMTENIGSDNPVWNKMQDVMNSVPVFQLSQQIVNQPYLTVKLVNGNEITYVVYPGTNNFGSIYAATYGRGLFLNNYFNRVGVDEIIVNETTSSIQNLKLYPNPVTIGKQVTIEMQASKNCHANLILYDLAGKVIFNREAYFQEGKNSFKIGTGNLVNGTYILQTVIGKETYSNKFIVK